MKALVISDTHGNTAAAFGACDAAGPVDVVFHLGDGTGDAELLHDALGVPVIGVAGNCDPFGAAPRELVWEGEGMRFLLVHGDAYGVKGGLNRLVHRGREVGADAILFGHSHLPLHESCNGMDLINPGTLSREAGTHTYAVLAITDGSLQVNHAILAAASPRPPTTPLPCP